MPQLDQFGDLFWVPPERCASAARASCAGGGRPGRRLTSNSVRGEAAPPRAIAVLDARGMRFEHEATPVRVHERMALTSVDLLSSIVTAWPAGLGGLGALAVDDCRRGAGVAPDPFAIRHHQRVVYQIIMAQPSPCPCCRAH